MGAIRDVISNEREVGCMNDQSVALWMPMMPLGRDIGANTGKGVVVLDWKTIPQELEINSKGSENTQLLLKRKNGWWRMREAMCDMSRCLYSNSKGSGNTQLWVLSITYREIENYIQE